MKNQPATKSSSFTSVQIYTALAVVLFLGGLGGYLLHSSGTPETAATDAPAVATTQPLPSAAQMLSTQAQPLLARLQTNPRDASALVDLGNLYYDASQWTDAIGYYTRALNESPSNPDVRTDLGIAYFYSGDADRALKEFDQALKDDPKHVQTLFNIGVVRLQGKNDPKGAIDAWESLLKIDPNYRDRSKVETMLADARSKLK
jgi:cytochrome c-type biogenesis protein CcmH/NrfG